MGNIIWNKTGYIHADPRQGPPAPQWSFASAETPFFTVFSYSGKQKTLEIARFFEVQAAKNATIYRNCVYSDFKFCKAETTANSDVSPT